MPIGGSANDPERARRFRDAALPHLDDVYTLARHLLRNTTDAEDAVQAARVKTFRQLSRAGDEAVAARDPAQCLPRGVCAPGEFGDCPDR
jgi:hypothetical protein